VEKPVQRVLLAAMAVMPAIFVYLTLPYTSSLTSAVWWDSALVVLAVLFSVLAIWLTTRELSSVALRDDGAFSLLRPDVRHQAKRDLPDPEARRETVHRVLLGPIATEQSSLWNTPPSFDDALRHAVKRILNAWEMAGVEMASDDDILELYLYCRVMQANAPEAGRLAQLFLKPDQILDMRDHLQAIGRAYHRFVTQASQFESVECLWENRHSFEGGLIEHLEALKQPDADLLHHIVLTHEPRFKPQMEAADWCLKSANCDKATVAAYFVRVIEDQLLVRALRVGDIAAIQRMSDILHLWNDGFYTQSELRLDLKGMASVYERGLFEEFETAKRLFPGVDLAKPMRLFKDYKGRPPRCRRNWSLTRGRMTSPPREEDYFDENSSAA
jgi:hypothetical protein